MKKKKASGAAVWRMMPYIKPFRGRYLFGLLAVSANSYVSSLLIGLLVGGMLEQAQSGSALGVLREAGKWMGIMAAWLALWGLGCYALANASRRAAAVLKRDLFRKMLRAPYRVSSRHHSGDLLSRLDSDALMCQQLYGDLFVRVLGAFLSVALGIVTVWSVHWSVAVALCAVGLFMMAVNSLLAQRNRERYRQEAKQRGETVAHMSDLLAGAQLVRIYGEDTGLIQRFSDSCHRLFSLSMRALNLRGLFNGINQVNAGLTAACSLALGLVLYRNGAVMLTALPLLIQMGGTIVNPVSGLGWMLDSWNEMAAGLERLTGLLGQEQEETAEVPKRQESRETGCGPAITASHVNFSYGWGKTALLDVSAVIPPGSVCGLVGYSGSGKSTFLRLLLGMEAYEGSFRIDGKEIRDIPLDVLRGQIGYVPQSCPLFEGTVFENIQMGNLQAGREEVLAAAKAADVDGFVAGLEQGYETMVGERGVKLSGGQRQRIAIARAILKDAKILLLDEATAALDSGAEQQIQKSLARLMEGRTTLIVAHRLSNVVDADQILVFDQGRIMQKGTCEELLREEGIFADLYRLQQS